VIFSDKVTMPRWQG